MSLAATRSLAGAAAYTGLSGDNDSISHVSKKKLILSAIVVYVCT
jgi:hypothetical protein